MPSLPNGTVTFLFTDIEGSTALAQQFPADLPALLARHHAILQQAIESHNGIVFQIIGDSFHAAFPTAPDALQAALDAQRNLQHEIWNPSPIKVRMGLHTGAAQAGAIEERAGGYVGYLTLTRVQRVMSVAHGGQILLSNPTAELVHGELPVDASLRDMGEHRLKGLLNPEHLWQLIAPDVRQDFPPLQSLNTIPNNLPVQLTSFIGREHEIAEVKQELAEHRLVTLTGSGGTGKTRLSLQVAAEVLDHFQHGVWFIELAPLVDPNLIPQTILSVMGISEQSGKAPLDVLKDYLHDKQTLLLLDNCEHLIEACAKVVNALLNAAPRLKILASSREALGVKGEVSYHVPSLSLPDPKHLPAIEQLSQYEAVRLFIDRALLVAPHFNVDRDNAPFIAQICYRLDGIPLAIELAAARVKMMSVEQISKRLDDRFRLLTGGARTALPRQQTLRALIDWSYGLLSENERLLLRRLAVFVASWTLEAAEEVCSGEDIDSDQVLDLLANLVNKSLVIVVEQAQSREARYRMLETVRQYARERLIDSGEGTEVRDRHLDYYRQVVKEAEPELFGSKELIWLVWLENEWGNLRAALEWSLEKRADAGLELVNCLGYFLVEHHFTSDLEDWLSQLMTHPLNSERSTARAHGMILWTWYAAASYKQSVNVPSILEDAIAIYRELGDKNGLAHGYLMQALLAAESQIQSGRFEVALDLFRDTNDKAWVAIALRDLGWFAKSHETPRKLAFLEESLSLSRELGYITGIIEASKQLGALELRQGHFEAARRRLAEGFSMWQAHATDLGNSVVLSYDLGDLAFYEGDYELAQRHYEDSLAWAIQRGEQFSVGWSQVRLGHAVLRRGQLQAAYQLFRQALLSFPATGMDFVLEGSIYTIEGLASLAVAQAEYDKAVRLLARADDNRKSRDVPRAPVEQAAVERDLAVIHSQLDEAAFKKAYKTGQAMTLDEAIDYALKED